jgi:hypothetical protein
LKDVAIVTARYDGKHSVEAELVFIGGIGSWSAAGYRCTREDLLKGYAKGLERRTHGFTPRELVRIRERLTVEMLAAGVSK